MSKETKQKARFTSTDEADGAEQPRLCVVHLQRQQLTSEGKHQFCEWTKAGIVHLCPVKSQAVREGHCVLLRCVTSAYPQHLIKRGEEEKRSNKVQKGSWQLFKITFLYHIDKSSSLRNEKALGRWEWWEEKRLKE